MFLVRLLKRIAVSLIVLLVILAVIGLFLPDRATVERSAVINAGADEVYPWIVSLRRFNEWSPWRDLDANADYQFTGPEEGEGATMYWSSELPSVGEGTQKIVAAETNESVRTELDFGSQGPASAEWILTPVDDDTTEITWRFDTEFGYDLIGRYFGLMLDGWIGQSYEKGLYNLKKRVESG